MRLPIVNRRSSRYGSADIEVIVHHLRHPPVGNDGQREVPRMRNQRGRRRGNKLGHLLRRHILENRGSATTRQWRARSMKSLPIRGGTTETSSQSEWKDSRDF